VHITFNDIVSAISALAALLASYHAIKANGKASVIKANVNGNIERLVDILVDAAITIPHETAAKVVATPPVDTEGLSPDDRLAVEFFQKLGRDVGPLLEKLPRS